VISLEWEICITCSHSNANTPPNIYIFTHLTQDSSKAITLNIQFAQDSTGSTVLSSQELDEFGWRAEILSSWAEVFHWESYHCDALKDLYCKLGFDPGSEAFAELPFTQLGQEFLTDSLTSFTNNLLYRL
jgi:hypothetical protein